MDTVYLLINGKKLDRFTSYSIDADIYSAASAFQLELARPGFSIKPGQNCELYVNDTLELTGIIDNSVSSYDKSGSKLIITGRDLMGWCVDAHVKDFITVQNYTVKALAERLLKKAPQEFFKLANIQYEENVVGRLKKKGARVAGYDTTNPLSQIEPGMSVFDVLSEYAKSKGMLFYSLPNATFVFGKPKETGLPAFIITHRNDGKGNNVLSGEKSDDIGKRYSEVTVVGQKQGQDGYLAGEINLEAIIPDTSFPFYKPYVHKDEFGGNQPKQQARMILEKMRHDGFRLNYTMQGHSQGSKNWSINELALVIDEDPDFQLEEAYLIYGRTFEKSKDKGTITKLRLSLPGMIV